MSRNHTHKWSATILMAAILFVVSSCDGVTPGGPGQELPEVILPQTDFNVPFMGGEVEVSFVPLTSWKVSCNAQFITFDKTGGEKSEEITTLKIKVLPNPDTKKRQAELELFAEMLRREQNKIAGAKTYSASELCADVEDVLRES